MHPFLSVPWPACISSICLSAWRERKGSPNPLVTKLGGPGAGWVGGSPAEFRGQNAGGRHLAATVSAAKRPKKRRARGRPNAHKSACANEALAHAGGTQDLPCPFVGVRSADLPSITGQRFRLMATAAARGAGKQWACQKWRSTMRCRSEAADMTSPCPVLPSARHNWASGSRRAHRPVRAHVG